jgi:hypothetical protein
MGKKDKEHRAKVAKRNAKVKEQKSGMQKAFDLLMKQQIEKLKENDGVDVSLSGQPLTFSVVDQNTPEINEENKEEDK